nr:SGNH/GDSL hydrolase family protein [bacterium]
MNALFAPGSRILFQGDSITDCDRVRGDDSSLGGGYLRVFADLYNALYPDNGVTFINRAVSGDTSAMMLARYEADVREVEPDFISILIGINDTWRRYDANTPTSAEVFYQNYRTFLSRMEEDFPWTPILMIEPFVTHVLPDRVTWHEDLDPKIQMVRKLAAEFADYYLPLDGIFAALQVGRYRAADLAADGVHPTPVGHSIIAHEMLKTLGML